VVPDFTSLRLTRRSILELIGLASAGAVLGTGCDPADVDEATTPATTPTTTPTATPAATPAAAARESELTAALRRQFSYLSIESGSIDAFAADFERHRGAWNSRRQNLPNLRFLASTDFFQHAADEERTIRYVTYYDPYISPCYNPFTGG